MNNIKGINVGHREIIRNMINGRLKEYAEGNLPEEGNFL